jgi:hypothetical protein
VSLALHFKGSSSSAGKSIILERALSRHLDDVRGHFEAMLGTGEGVIRVSLHPEAATNLA